MLDNGNRKTGNGNQETTLRGVERGNGRTAERERGKGKRERMEQRGTEEEKRDRREGRRSMAKQG